MIPCSPALQTHLDQQYQTMCTCWHVVLTNGTELGFTDHDRDIDGNDIPEYVAPNGEVSPGGGDIIYRAAPSYTRSDIASNSDISVDNLEVVGMMESPLITEDDLNAGIWDFASIRIFAVNYESLGDGALALRSGWIGEVSLQRNKYQAELRGLTQAYSRTIGELTSPNCRNNLGDARCQVDLPALMVTGALTADSQDRQTMYDSGRTEPGPEGAVNITNITKANPGVVTTDASLNLPAYSPVQISGVTGMTPVNTTTSIRNPSGNTFELPLDTTNFPTYTGGGTVTPLGGGSAGYFDYGVMTFTSGANAGLSMEVRSYVPGSWVLVLPMPYPALAGDAYEMTPGCDKTLPTCKAKFNQPEGNVVNFRGEWYLPGNDKILQVGRQMEAIT